MVQKLMNSLSAVLWKVMWFCAFWGAFCVLFVVHMWIKYVRKPKKIGFPEYPVWAVHEHASDPPATSSTRPRAES